MTLPVRALSTCRLQFNADFRFADAKELVAYLSRLGITHLYASPLLRARSGSTHGYDVVDPRVVNSAIGDETEYRSLVTNLQAHGLGVILDIVPNHMSASQENFYWEQVLTYGASSPYARWFDIDWRMPHPELWGRVLVPVLGESLGRVLMQDQLQVYWHEGRFRVKYFEHEFPLDPATLPSLCEFGLEKLRETLRAGHPALAEIEGIIGQLAQLPNRTQRARGKTEFSLETADELMSQLAQTIEFSPQTHEWARATAEEFGEGPDGQKRLRKLLHRQNYRLVHWRRAARILNYRRFFDINDLISVRQEDPEVFQETHALLARWWEEGLIDGVRIDHIDGLRDPYGYLCRLQDLFQTSEAEERKPLVFVEKILAHHEQLPEDWPATGTTGYEYLNAVEALFISPSGFEEIENGYRRLLGRPMRFERVAQWGKRRILKSDLSAFVGRLADSLYRLSQLEPASAAITRREHVDALVEYCVALRCYRTYIDTRGQMSAADQQMMQAAIEAAGKTERATPHALGFLAHVLLDPEDDSSEAQQQERINFLQRLQQLTGPAAAKGIEDTALYAYVPLVSLNEVGGEPDVDLNAAVDNFHISQLQRQQTSPQAMLCVTSHDTKRSADVRARLDVLSEWPKLWEAYVNKWRRWNRGYKTRVQDRLAPDPTSEYLFYQSLVGIWPVDAAWSETCLTDADFLQSLRDRLDAYMLKAVREAKLRTNWTSGDAAFETAVSEFVKTLISQDSPEAMRFLEDVRSLVQRISRSGLWNGLSRTMLQLTSPGTPDLYQGDELWNLTLVDPDNRQPVDFEHRRRLLNQLITEFDADAETRGQLIQQLVEEPEDGRIKMHVYRTVLQSRREDPFLFGSGSYVPVEVRGEHAESVVTFARIHEERAAIVVVPRLISALLASETAAPVGADFWQDTCLVLDDALRNTDWRSQCTGNYHVPTDEGTLPLSAILQDFPVALLTGNLPNMKTA